MTSAELTRRHTLRALQHRIDSPIPLGLVSTLIALRDKVAMNQPLTVNQTEIVKFAVERYEKLGSP